LYAPIVKTRSMCATVSTTIADAPQWWMPRTTDPLVTARSAYRMLSYA
jgi:hypothetical protein